MPRYIVERTFPDGAGSALGMPSAAPRRQIVSTNSEEQVTWIHSYGSVDDRRTFCVCDAPSPEAIRSAARRNALPVDRITEVRIIDPYFGGPPEGEGRT